MRPVERRWRVALLTLCLLAGAGAETAANDIDATLELAGVVQREAAQAQARIDALAGQLAALREGKRSTDPRVAAARVELGQYQTLREQFAADLNAQQQALTQLQRLEREVLPLLIDMADSLLQFVELDLPFARAQRLARANSLRAGLGRADAGLAEQYLQLVDAWRDENRYNRTIALHVEAGPDGRQRLLRIGRIALYRLRGSRVDVWQRDTERWQTLGKTDADAVRRAARQVEQGHTAWAQLPVPQSAEADGP